MLTGIRDPDRGSSPFIAGRSLSFWSAFGFCLLLPVVCSAQQRLLRDLDACVAAKTGSGWSIDFRRGDHEQIEQVVEQLREDREAIITYMDATRPADLAAETVRNILWDMTDQLLRLRCLDQRLGEVVEKRIVVWMNAVELAVRASEQRRCIEFCETAVPACDPVDC